MLTQGSNSEAHEDEAPVSLDPARGGFIASEVELIPRSLLKRDEATGPQEHDPATDSGRRQL